jgi:hypothetical protein
MGTRRIILIVSDREVPETVPARYRGSAEDMLWDCRVAVDERDMIYTTSPTVVAAFQQLHKLREIDVTVFRAIGEKLQIYDLDVNGDFIEPWPDEFFEVDFYLRFPGAKGTSDDCN